MPYAVFDLQFHPSRHSLFARATSTGSVALFDTAIPTSSTPAISLLWTHSVHEDPSVSALYLSWAPAGWFRNPQVDALALTFSNGQTGLFASGHGDISEEDSLFEVGSFEAKQTIEMWFVALATLDEKRADSTATRIPFMFTGDDFGTFYTRQFDTTIASVNVSDGTSRDIVGSGSQQLEGSDEQKIEGEKSDIEKIQTIQDFTDRARHHTAGITSILPLPIVPEENDNAPLVLTGSYDEYLRVYSVTRPGKVLAEHSLGGGVWRLQLLGVHGDEDLEPNCAQHPHQREFLVLASCMHAGTRVVRVSRQGDVDDSHGKWSIEVIAEFTEHESMNYASDVSRGLCGDDDLVGQERQQLLCVSSSFYDRRVCVWRVEI